MNFVSIPFENLAQVILELPQRAGAVASIIKVTIIAIAILMPKVVTQSRVDTVINSKR